MAGDVQHAHDGIAQRDHRAVLHGREVRRIQPLIFRNAEALLLFAHTVDVRAVHVDLGKFHRVRVVVAVIVRHRQLDGLVRKGRCEAMDVSAAAARVDQQRLVVPLDEIKRGVNVVLKVDHARLDVVDVNLERMIFHIYIPPINGV